MKKTISAPFFHCAVYINNEYIGVFRLDNDCPQQNAETQISMWSTFQEKLAGRSINHATYSKNEKINFSTNG